MGRGIDAICDCGYESGLLLLGCGMSGPAVLFPCYCKDCKELVVVDLLKKRIRCPKCRRKRPLVIYDEPEMIGELGSEVVDRYSESTHRLGRDLTLTNGTYLCPKCGQHRLRFGTGPLALWD